MSTQEQIKSNIKNDINDIDLILNKENVNLEDLKKMHIKIDGKYQTKIKDWGKSMYNWLDSCGFDYEYCSSDSLKENLITMKYKLEGYLQDYGVTKSNTSSKSVNYYNVNTNRNENMNIINIDINIDFSQLQDEIKNMESLTSEETGEALEKLKELEKIYCSKDSRKKKWENAKKILVWIADKSVDLAITYFPIISKILTQ